MHLMQPVCERDALSSPPDARIAQCRTTALPRVPVWPMMGVGAYVGLSGGRDHALGPGTSPGSSPVAIGMPDRVQSLYDPG